MTDTDEFERDVEQLRQAAHIVQPLRNGRAEPPFILDDDAAACDRILAAYQDSQDELCLALDECDNVRSRLEAAEKVARQGKRLSDAIIWVGPGGGAFVTTAAGNLERLDTEQRVFEEVYAAWQTTRETTTGGEG